MKNGNNVGDSGWYAFYDPDCHIIEVGETMKTVCRRFLNSGLTPEQVAARMEVPMKFVKNCIR